MLSHSNPDPASRYLSPDQLRIGIYVFVDLPWFSHPFTLNDFRISTEEQIAELRALRLARVRYDPERSDGVIAEDTAAGNAEPAHSAAVKPPQEAAPSDPAATEKDKRAQRSREYRSLLAQTEKSFIKAAGLMRRLNRDILQYPKAALAEMYDLVDQMATVFLDRADVSLRVMGEKCGGEEAYDHGLNVSILSLMLAKGLELTPEQAKILGTGALLHDIGKIEIPDRVLRKDPDERSKAERALHARHVEYGLQIGARIGLPVDALAIIGQHHELADGSGYPHMLKLEQTTRLARVASLVNYYDNLCNPVILSQAMTPHEALSFVFARRRDQFDARVLQLMIRCLGVYPPGTVVRLSNDAIGIVSSVNSRKPLRPWVLLYDASVPAHEAIMMNLEEESTVSIAKGLRPSILPPAVYAYLSPRKRITYFFDAELRPFKDGE